MTHYGVIGSGEHSANMIQDGLKEIYDEDTKMYVYCRVGASPSERVVYDWLLDNEKNFTAVTNGKAPSILIETAEYILEGGHRPEDTIIKELAANNGRLLVLWDDNNSKRMEDLIFKASDMGVEVLELSNGLAPIITEQKEEPSKEVEKFVEATEVDIDPLTETELNDMSVGLLKKAAFAQGIADAGGMSKEQLVKVLADAPEVSSDTHVANTNAGAHMAIIVWYQDGIMQAMPVPLEQVKPLLG